MSILFAEIFALAVPLNVGEIVEHGEDGSRGSGPVSGLHGTTGAYSEALVVRDEDLREGWKREGRV